MTVLQLVPRDNSETIKALEYLVEQARNGEITGLAMCFRMATGREQAVFTGIYRAHPERAIQAGMQISMQLTRDQYEAP